MKKIISFEKHWNRKQNEEIKTTEHYESKDNMDAFLGYMTSEVSKIQDKPGTEILIYWEKEDRKKFEKRYSDVLARASISAADRIQFFAGVMLHLLPSIFHGKYERRYESYMDFSKFYLTEFDTAFSQYRNEKKEYEQEYPFRFSPLADSVALENELQNYLQQLIAPSPAKSSREKAEIIMWQACRLFELFHNIEELFSGENFEK